MLTIIAAVGANRELGKNGDLCFRLPADLKLFKKTTMSHKILMGRNTYESLPRRLEGRDYYVATRDPEGLAYWCHQVDCLEEFIRDWMYSDEEVFVIGGGSIYRQCLPYCQKLILTEVDAFDGDAETFFPIILPDEWTAKTLEHGVSNGYHFEQVEYTRK